MRRSLGLVGALVLVSGAAAPAAAVLPDLAKPIAGTRCSEFPADNWWHADISHLPVHARSAAWLSHMDTDVDLHPDFGPSYGDGPNYGIPITVVGKKHSKSKVSFDYSSESDHVKYPLGNDTKIEGGRSSDGDRHAIIVDKDKCKLYELFAASYDGRHWHAGSGAVWSLKKNKLRPDGWTSADAAGLPILPGLLRWNEVKNADMVILLHREDIYEKESARPGEADLIVAKHRNGPTRDITVAFQGHYSRFVDMAH